MKWETHPGCWSNLFELKRVTTNNNDTNQLFGPTSGLSWSSINNDPISWRNNDRQQSRGGRGRGVDPACFRQYREWNCGHPPGTGTWAGAGAMTSTSGPQTIRDVRGPGPTRPLSTDRDSLSLSCPSSSANNKDRNGKCCWEKDSSDEGDNVIKRKWDNPFFRHADFRFK